MSQFLIASLKHTHKHHEHITFWGPLHRGYNLVISAAGRYCFGEASSLNDGLDHLAVSLEAVQALQSPEPYFMCHGEEARFYDTRGPVVSNTRANWNALIAASLVDGRHDTPKPELYRGKRRAFASPSFEAKKVAVLRHSLGLRDDGRGRSYRNHFVTGRGSDDFDACESLVLEGLMTHRHGNALTGWDDVFVVTGSGVARAAPMRAAA